jgi:phosphopantetheinyl transferase
MPIIYQHQINESTVLGLWHITEPESFFAEVAIAQRDIAHVHKRLQHLAGRYMLAHLQPEFPYSLVDITENNKPFLPGNPVHFSIAHCGDFAAAIVSRDKHVGIDVEVITPRVEKVRDKFLSAAEQGYLRTIKSMEHIQLLTLCWCIKEAIYKWYGLGGVDFIRDMVLDKIDFKNHTEGFASCRFLKENPQELTLAYKFIGEACVCWV